MNPTANNIPIKELIEALTDMMLRGNKYVDVLIDNDFILRLRGLKSLKDKNKPSKDNKRIGDGQIPPLPGGIELIDLT